MPAYSAKGEQGKIFLKKKKSQLAEKAGARNLKGDKESSPAKKKRKPEGPARILGPLPLVSFYDKKELGSRAGDTTL